MLYVTKLESDFSTTALILTYDPKLTAKEVGGDIIDYIFAGKK